MPVRIHVNVYHENQTQLTDEEIIEEALGYAEDAKLNLTEGDVDTIQVLEKTI